MVDACVMGWKYKTIHCWSLGVTRWEHRYRVLDEMVSPSVDSMVIPGVLSNNTMFTNLCVLA